jgi:hypothetical protein
LEDSYSRSNDEALHPCPGAFKPPKSDILGRYVPRIHDHKCPSNTLLTETSGTGFGHITIAYIASDFVAPETASYFQTLLRNDSTSYLAGIATWADSIRYTKWGHFTGPFHFIDAHDQPPTNCTVDFERDCKEEGCVITAIANYTSQLLDPRVPVWQRAQAAKFVVHFVGDIHQPLHTEDVARGGNGIHVKFEGTELNLHHVWDSSIAEKLVGGVRRAPYAEARRWADEVTESIRTGKFESLRGKWLEGMELDEPKTVSMTWAKEGNALVCSHGELLTLFVVAFWRLF